MLIRLKRHNGLIKKSSAPAQFQCFCAKNWYITQACRIKGERHTLFPYTCALSHVLRTKKLLDGFMVAPGSNPVTIREHSFLDNPNVPDEIKVMTCLTIHAPCH